VTGTPEDGPYGAASPAAGASPTADGHGQAPPGANATVKVSVFHNVETVMIGGELHHVGFDGYQPGHALVRVFEAEVPAGLAGDPQRVADLMFEIGNAPLEYLSGRELEMAERYRFRGLRSLSVGDLVAVGEIAFACGRRGWDLVTGTVNVTGTGEPGSLPLPRAEVGRAAPEREEDTRDL
jgi:hypothetical protein